LVEAKKRADVTQVEGAGNNLRDIKDKIRKKGPATKSASSARKNRTTQQASSAEELDMTGWSGDYNLPK
jgi:hypothetical protein